MTRFMMLLSVALIIGVFTSVVSAQSDRDIDKVCGDTFVKYLEKQGVNPKLIQSICKTAARYKTERNTDKYEALRETFGPASALYKSFDRATVEKAITLLKDDEKKQSSGTPTFVLDDKTYLEYKKQSPLFRYAESKLNISWKQLKSVLNKKEYQVLLKGQRKWLKNRDNLATKLFTEMGLSKVEAYSVVSLERSQYLTTLLREEDSKKDMKPSLSSKSKESASNDSLKKELENAIKSQMTVIYGTHNPRHLSNSICKELARKFEMPIQVMRNKKINILLGPGVSERMAIKCLDNTVLDFKKFKLKVLNKTANHIKAKYSTQFQILTIDPESGIYVPIEPMEDKGEFDFVKENGKWKICKKPS